MYSWCSLFKRVSPRNGPSVTESCELVGEGPCPLRLARGPRYVNLIYGGLVRRDEAGSTAIGFVLIGTAPTKEKEVYQALLKVKEVVELYPLFGDYDLIAKVEAPDYNMIGEIVVSKIRAIDGVRATKTLARMAF